MKRFWIVGLVVVFAVTAGVGTPVMAAAEGKFKAQLTPLQEPPICSSEGSGTFEATLSDDETTVAYELTYTLEEPSVVRQAHIHLAQRGVNGGIIVWLCQVPPDFTDPTSLAPLCPDSPTTVTGTFTSANVIAITAQGIAAGEFDELLRAMRNGFTYANVHSNLCGGGEVRGQIR
jgi:hypothetical protein